MICAMACSPSDVPPLVPRCWPHSTSRAVWTVLHQPVAVAPATSASSRKPRDRVELPRPVGVGDRDDDDLQPEREGCRACLRAHADLRCSRDAAIRSVSAPVRGGRTRVSPWLCRGLRRGVGAGARSRVRRRHQERRARNASANATTYQPTAPVNDRDASAAAPDGRSTRDAATRSAGRAAPRRKPPLADRHALPLRSAEPGAKPTIFTPATRPSSGGSGACSSAARGAAAPSPVAPPPTPSTPARRAPDAPRPCSGCCVARGRDRAVRTPSPRRPPASSVAAAPASDRSHPAPNVRCPVPPAARAAAGRPPPIRVAARSRPPAAAAPRAAAAAARPRTRPPRWPRGAPAPAARPAAARR